jgi:hypothetical protein
MLDDFIARYHQPQVTFVLEIETVRAITTHREHFEDPVEDKRLTRPADVRHSISRHEVL